METFTCDFSGKDLLRFGGVSELYFDVDYVDEDYGLKPTPAIIVSKRIETNVCMTELQKLKYIKENFMDKKKDKEEFPEWKKKKELDLLKKEAVKLNEKIRRLEGNV